MRNKAKIIEFLAWAAMAAGGAALGYTVYLFPIDRLSLGLSIFALFTVFFSSYLQIQLPRTKLYFTISDTLIFIALLNYGGEAAIVLATLESLFTSLNFKRKGIKIKTKTLFLNGAIAALTTFATVHLLRLLFDSVSDFAAGSMTNFVKIVSVMALAQFLSNSLVVSLFATTKDDKSFWKIWNENCLNALIIYVAGAFAAGFFTKAFQQIEPFTIGVTIGVSALIYLTYRRYLNDIKDAAAKAELAERERTDQAERHIEELQHYIGEQERIAQALRESHERYRHAAFHDDLTGLPNRNFFIDMLKFLLERAKYQEDLKFAVLFLDLNRFKTINDSLGHLAGDRLITHVAQRLTSLMREGDLVARFSGDEFGIILKDLPADEYCAHFADLVRRRLLTPFTLNGRQVFTSVSIGIAVYNNSKYQEAEDILRDADIAMYYAKRRNKNFMVFDQTMHARAVTLLQLETDLRHAIDRDELLAYYQPIVDLATMKLKGFEALMRWKHPQRGIVPPVEFIPVAEETGMIVPLTLWILQESCRTLAGWQARSPLNHSLIVSINLSGKHFAQPDIVDQIRRIILETGVNPSSVKLEITESAVMENAEATIMMLKQLRALGVNLSIDDFGTGYSSLSYLHRFPIDTLKVDRSFVSTMEDGSENGEIVRTIIALAKTLNLDVVAEGIETIHQLHQLRILGCEYGQGYLFSRPVPLDEAQEILDDPTRWQNVIPNNNPASVAQNREFTHLTIAN
ncbi:MAG: EAL domain-containing protein [Acidobacteria bacterium]|nr:EAL domain-containing protein [Acidobacteriota bacterium]